MFHKRSLNDFISFEYEKYTDLLQNSEVYPTVYRFQGFQGIIHFLYTFSNDIYLYIDLLLLL